MRRLLVLIATAALVVATASIPAEARTRAGRYAQQAFTATNAERADHGLTALTSNQCLRDAAVRQATLMAQRERLFHQDLDRVLRNCGLRAAAENIAYGYPSGRSVVQDGWMRSAGHRANILNARFRLMGIGARKGHNGRWYVAQLFGTPR